MVDFMMRMRDFRVVSAKRALRRPDSVGRLKNGVALRAVNPDGHWALLVRTFEKAMSAKLIYYYTAE